MANNQDLLRSSLCASHPSISDLVTLHAFGVGANRTTCYLFSDAINRGDGIPLCDARDEKHAVQLFNNNKYMIRGAMQIERVDDVIKVIDKA